MFIPWLLMSLCIVGKKKTRHTHTHKTFSFLFFFFLLASLEFYMFSPLGVASHVITNEFNIGMDLDVKMLRRRRTLPLDRLLFYYYYFSVSFYIFCVGAFLCREFVKCWANVDTIEEPRPLKFLVGAVCVCVPLVIYLHTVNNRIKGPTAGGKPDKKGCSTRVSSLVITFSHFLRPSKGFRVVAFITHIFQPPTDRLIVLGNDIITCRPLSSFLLLP